ncbi:hypothetical protein GGI12_003929 [Dipsacomyces acuminosporus]|nr:hypothetical protein GGI12_003929 [Dipsacomyces acuminosporus]
MPGSSDESSLAQMYELEAKLRQMSEANMHAQKEQERLEKKYQFVVDELDVLQKSHSRLEAQFFEAEAELASVRANLDRAQRANAALESSLERKAAALEREREGWQKREGELSAELAAVKKKATLQRRQTVSLSSPSRSNSGAGLGHSHRMSMFAHDLPAIGNSSGLLSPRAGSRTAIYEGNADIAGHEDAFQQPSDTQQQQQQQVHQQLQVQQLMRKLREAELGALRASKEADQARHEAEQASSELGMYQEKVEKLEHAVGQLNELNETLREDNESYQVLLQMGTIKGGFSFSNAPRSSLESRASSTKWGAALSETPEETAPSYAHSARPDVSSEVGLEPEDGPHADAAAESARAGQGLDLASELSQVLSIDGNNGNSSSTGGGGGQKSRASELEEQNTQLKEELRKIKYERRHLNEENKALTIYVNKILGRILASSDGLEAVLSSDYDSAAAKPKPGPRPRPNTSYAMPPKHMPKGKSSSSSSARSTSSPRPRGLQLPGARSSNSSQPEVAFPERGSGDGVTSVFIPPSSPLVVNASQEQQLPPQVFTGRARSATHSAGMSPPPRTLGGGSSSANNGGGGAWWKRMSVRFGSGWAATQDGTDSAAAQFPPVPPK